MTNKSAEEILLSVVAPYNNQMVEPIHGYMAIPEISIAEASRQLYEAELQRIGEDEYGVVLEDGSIEDWEPIYRNRFRAELRAAIQEMEGK